MANKHFVIVSLGSIGQRHLRNLRELYPKAVITVVRRTGKSSLISEELADHVVSAVSEAIEIAPPTAGIIASPAPFHIEDAKEFIRKECPVFIEKPLSHNLDGVSELIELAKINSVPCVIGYILRFLPAFKKMKQIITEKRYGDVLNVSISVGQYLPSWRPDQDYRMTVSAQERLGGGALLELSHEIDYMLELFGVPDKEFAIIQSSSRLEIDVEDQVDAVLYYKNGAVVNLHLDFLQKVASRYCMISFEEANIRWDIIGGEFIINVFGEEPLMEDVPTVTNEVYKKEIEYFMKAVSGEVKADIDLEQGARVLRLIDKLRKSALISSGDI